MQPRWKDGSRGMLTVNAIFAGFSGVLLVNLVLRERSSQSPLIYTSIALSAVALYLFAFAAERITDALDEGKPSTYLWSMQMYNAGVIFVITSIAVLLWSHVGPWGLAVILLALWPWAKDFVYLCGSSNWNSYLEIIQRTG